MKDINMIRFIFLLTFFVFFGQQTNAGDVVLYSDVNWEQLNPARGDKSPKAGTLWGDRKGSEPTGFLVKFVDGFSSPPHIHNVSYRGVVISGLIHNDDPKAESIWMPVGSFWTQPEGEVHITSAKGKENVAYIEIEDSPYLVYPPEKAFQSDEVPVNVDSSNIVWLDYSDSGAKISYLWGQPKDGKLNGTFIKLPAGFKGTVQSKSSTFRAVVITGNLKYKSSGKNKRLTLKPCSYFSSSRSSDHQMQTKKGSVIYVRTIGKYKVVPE